MSKSKFAGIFKTRESGTEAPPVSDIQLSAKDSPEEERREEEKPSKTALSKRKAKYSDSSYLHTTVYVKRTVINDVKKGLLDEPEENREFSGLVEMLLQKWVEDKKKQNT